MSGHNEKDFLGDDFRNGDHVFSGGRMGRRRSDGGWSSNVSH